MSQSKTRHRSVNLAVRLSPEEAEAIKTKARDAGVTVSAFFRASALGRRTRSTLDSQIINELRRLGGLQKHLFNESGGARSQAFAAVLVEIERAVARIDRDEE